ncbi:MAG: MmgE/PrpD family protein, partial [Gammaproteobacteria bacterium]|nr:MmgE/PrpD family protein [Gammaproteobacteria bacterium]
RSVKPDMAVNYARLCAQYVVARVLQRGELDLSDFSIEALRDEATLALAQRVEVVEQPDHDPNALTPVTVEIRLADGTRLERSLDVIYGNPARPMSAEARTRKLAHCWQHARLPLAEDGPARLQSMVDALEELADVRVLLDLCTACS